MLEICIQEVGRVVTREVATPVAERGEALVAVRSAGICGSDIHVFEGRNPGLHPPHVSGHEFGGVVEELVGEVGKLAGGSGISVGDHVAVNPVLSCRSCDMCARGFRYLCDKAKVIGGRHPGAMREKIAVPIENLVKVPDSFALEQIALIEPLANVLHYAEKYRNSRVLIIGAGTVGLLTLMVCGLNGNRTACCDIEANRIAHARASGADLAFDFRSADRDELISDFAGKAGVDVVFDIVSSEETISFATESAKRHGDVVIVGIPPGPIPVSVSPIMGKELHLSSTYMFGDDEFEKAARYLHCGMIDGSSLVSATFPFEDAHEAFTYKAETPCAKVVLTN